MFVFWANYCKNSNNPFLPRFDGFEKFIFDERMYLQIRMERLTEAGQYGEALLSLSEYITENSAYYSRSNIHEGYYEYMFDSSFDNVIYYKQLKKIAGKHLELLVQTVFDIDRIGYDYGWNFDLHQGNYMLRNNTPVIVDPWVIG
jgi:hypothetical protein